MTSELLEVLKGRCPSGRGRSKGPEKKPLLVAERRTEARALEAGPRSQVKEFGFHSNRIEPWEPFSKITDLIPSTLKKMPLGVGREWTGVCVRRGVNADTRRPVSVPQLRDPSMHWGKDCRRHPFQCLQSRATVLRV